MEHLHLRSKKTKAGIGILLLFLVIGLCTFFQVQKSFASDGGEPCYEITYQGKRLSEQGYIDKNTPYIPLSVLENCGDTSKLTIDRAKSRISIDLAKQNLLIGDKTTSDFIKTYGGTVYLPLRTLNETQCVPLNTITQFAKLAYKINDNTIQLTSMTNSGAMARIATANAQLAVSQGAPFGSSVPLAKGDLIFIQKEAGNFYKIDTVDGLTGYVLKPQVNPIGQNENPFDLYLTKKEKLNRGSQKINLVWQYVGTITPQAPSPNKGIDILAPTWFDQIVEGNGNIENNGDKGYTDLAHANNFTVWATITNNMSTKGSTNYTSKVLANSTLMKKTVAQYLFYAALYDVDGINIDYEQLKDADKDGLTAFTSTLRNYTERLGLILSIDTPVPKSWTVEYDMAALSKQVDYLAVMSYDEHWSGSPLAGSVSSHDFVVESIENSLKDVPSSKLLMGIPLYTRIWSCDATGKPVKNISATMSKIRNIVSENNLTPVWNDTTKQYYTEYVKDGFTNKIWIEDPRSLSERLALIKDYNLAGSGCWQYNQGEDRIWNVFQRMLKKDADKQEFANPY